jgi:hypothetical protein
VASSIAQNDCQLSGASLKAMMRPSSSVVTESIIAGG